MNKLKNNIIKILFGILIFTSFSSCDEGGNPDPGKTATGQFNGDWFISATDTDGAAAVDHALHSTYNTAANDNTMWIDDFKKGYEIKCKVTINTDGTFSSVASPNLYDLDDSGVPVSSVTITDGKIEKAAGTSKAGHVVDKITFRAHFSYDPDGYDLLYEGHKRTGFLEDEY